MRKLPDPFHHSIYCADRIPVGNRVRVTRQTCRELLTGQYEKYQSSIISCKENTFCPMTLWHSTFIDLYANFDSLERACGREGYEVAQKHEAYAQAWVQLADAQRCLLHAVLIQSRFQAMEIGTEPSIHVPMSFYYCGIAWTSYIRFGGGLRTDHRGSCGKYQLPRAAIAGRC